jgi:tetratricopeptide (TPR) repeat protein
LAKLYKSLGRDQEAEPLFLQSIELLQQTLPENHPDIARSLQNLSKLYAAQGRADEAESAQNLSNIAFIHESRGRFDDAKQLFKEAEAMLGWKEKELKFCTDHTQAQVEGTLKAAAKWKKKRGGR